MKNYRLFIFVSYILPLVFGMFFGSVDQGYAQSNSGWTEPINLSNSGSSTDPSLIIDAKGVIRVIWVDEFDGYKYVESADGITWTTPVTVRFPFLPEDNPRPVFLADPSGEIHILWQDKSNALYYSRTLPSSFDKPSTWTGRNKLANSVVGFEAEVGSRGMLHVGYVTSLGTDTGPAGVYYRRLAGSGWSAARNLYSSQYFRSLELGSANVRLSISTENDVDNIYVVWDDRPQKRIFLAKSVNSGDLWEGVAQVQGPEDFSGLELPYNVNVNVVNGRTLLVWQVGIPGSYCTQYSQWSIDEGNQFGPPVRLMDEFSTCPQQIDFIVQDNEFSVALLNVQDDLSMIAWNGSAWSELQVQNQLSIFVNSATLDSVLFACQKVSAYNQSLFAVGCDGGVGGDIWFSSRLLGSLEEWFPPPSAWTSPFVLTGVDQAISALSSVADANNNIHIFWVQSPLSATEEEEPTILYARWNEKWSEPRSIISGFNRIPAHLSATIDAQGRLLLSWVDGKNGDLYFSWANADRASIAVEWSRPVQVPTSSQLSSSPDILVDDSGKIVIAYSVPLNEDRGIYIVQSDDLGNVWSQPVSVMNAVDANWDSTDRPVISLSGDGRLHVLFTRYSLREDGKPEGLYYSQSANGGTSWSPPHVVSERHVQWSGMVYLNDEVLHLVWQENLGTGLVTLHQVSHDGGVSWENSVSLSNLPDNSAETALATDAEGHIHIIQAYVRDDNLVLQMMMWDGSHWSQQEGRDVDIKESNVKYSIVAEVASRGTIQVVISLVYPDLVDEMGSEIISINRSLGESTDGQPVAPLLISTPSILSDQPEIVDVQVTPTESLPLSNLVDVTPPSRRNLFGLLIVGVLTILIVVFVLPGRKKKSE